MTTSSWEKASCDSPGGTTRRPEARFTGTIDCRLRCTLPRCGSTITAQNEEGAAPLPSQVAGGLSEKKS